MDDAWTEIISMSSGTAIDTLMCVSTEMQKHVYKYVRCCTHIRDGYVRRHVPGGRYHGQFSYRRKNNIIAETWRFGTLRVRRIEAWKGAEKQLDIHLGNGVILRHERWHNNRVDIYEPMWWIDDDQPIIRVGRANTDTLFYVEHNRPVNITVRLLDMEFNAYSSYKARALADHSWSRLYDLLTFHILRNRYIEKY